MTIARLNSNLEVLVNFAQSKEEDSYSVSLLISTDNRFFIPEESNDCCMSIFYFFQNCIARLIAEGVCYFFNQTSDAAFDLRRVVQILSADFEAGFSENLQFFQFSCFLNLGNEAYIEKNLECNPCTKERWTLEAFQNWKTAILSKYPEGATKEEILSQEIQYQVAMMKAYALFKEVIQTPTLQSALQQGAFQDVNAHVLAISSYLEQLQTSLEAPLQALEQCVTQREATFSKVTNTFDAIYEALCKTSPNFSRTAIANHVL